MSWTYLDGLLGDRPAVVSFRPSPRSVLSGRWDRTLRAWFRAAPTDRDTWWAYFHEPEDDVERGFFRARQFKQAWKHVDQIARSVDNPRLHATVILMCWTPQEKSGRDWRDFVPADGRVDVLAFDCYAKGRESEAYADPERMFAAGYRAARAIGAEWAVSELGAIRDSADDGTRSRRLDLRCRGVGSGTRPLRDLLRRRRGWRLPAHRRGVAGRVGARGRGLAARR